MADTPYKRYVYPDEDVDVVPLPAPRSIERYVNRYTPPARRKGADETSDSNVLTRRASFGSSFLTAYSRSIRGRGRVANTAVEGYVVYVGYGQMPDFMAAPAGFATALPVPVTITPPLAGTVTLWVVTRRRNTYGVESQNTQPTFITIDTAGNEAYGPLSAPSISGVIAVEDESFVVQMAYPGFATDTDPADTWRLYVGAGVAPVPGVDVPVNTGTVTAGIANCKVGPYPTGGITYYFAVTVYRTVDGVTSAAGTFQFVLPADPAEPQATPGVTIADNEV